MYFKRIVRPTELVLPTAQHIDCIRHALEIMKSEDNMPDILVVLLANNVTVKSQWITECVKIMEENPDITSVVPVYEDNDHHPLRAKIIGSDGTLEMYEKISAEKFQQTARIYRNVCFWHIIFGY